MFSLFLIFLKSKDFILPLTKEFLIISILLFSFITNELLMVGINDRYNVFVFLKKIFSFN